MTAGLAELTMRQLEADWAKSHSSARGLQRSPAAYDTATMLLDVSQQAWKVLYINAQASRVTGASSAKHCSCSQAGYHAPSIWPLTLCHLLSVPCRDTASITPCKQSPVGKTTWKASELAFPLRCPDARLVLTQDEV